MSWRQHPVSSVLPNVQVKETGRPRSSAGGGPSWQAHVLRQQLLWPFRNRSRIEDGKVGNPVEILGAC